MSIVCLGHTAPAHKELLPLLLPPPLLTSPVFSYARARKPSSTANTAISTAIRVFRSKEESTLAPVSHQLPPTPTCGGQLRKGKRADEHGRRGGGGVVRPASLGHRGRAGRPRQGRQLQAGQGRPRQPPEARNGPAAAAPPACQAHQVGEEDAGHRGHGPAPVHELALAVVLEHLAVLAAQAQGVKPVVCGAGKGRGTRGSSQGGEFSMLVERAGVVGGAGGGGLSLGGRQGAVSWLGAQVAGRVGGCGTHRPAWCHPGAWGGSLPGTCTASSNGWQRVGK